MKTLKNPEIVLNPDYVWSWECYRWRKKYELTYNIFGFPITFDLLEKLLLQGEHLLPAQAYALPNLRKNDMSAIYVNRVSRDLKYDAYVSGYESVWSVMFVLRFTPTFKRNHHASLSMSDMSEFWLSVEGLDRELVFQLLPIKFSPKLRPSKILST